MLSSIKSSILFTISHATFVEWLGYGFVFIAFLLVLFLAIFIASRSWWQVGFLLIVADFGGFFYGIYAANDFLASRLHDVSISQINSRKLEYSDALLMEFDLKNNGKKPVFGCQIHFNFYYPSENSFKDIINSLKPFRTSIIEFTSTLYPQQSEHVVRAIKGFSATSYGIKKRVECY